MAAIPSPAWRRVGTLNVSIVSVRPPGGLVLLLFTCGFRHLPDDFMSLDTQREACTPGHNEIVSAHDDSCLFLFRNNVFAPRVCSAEASQDVFQDLRSIR